MFVWQKYLSDGQIQKLLKTDGIRTPRHSRESEKFFMQDIGRTGYPGYFQSLIIFISPRAQSPQRDKIGVKVVIRGKPGGFQ
jgi:hypothetical protein